MRSLIQRVKVKATGKIIEVYQIKEVPDQKYFNIPELDQSANDIIRITSSTYCDFMDCKTIYRQKELEFL